MTRADPSAQLLDPHLLALENEAIHILREGVAEARNPVLLFSAGKDSTVLAHLALRAFHPARPPLTLLHVDSTWEFGDVIAFRDAFARTHGLTLRVHLNEEGRAAGLNPFEHGDSYTRVMRTDALRQALDVGDHDVIFGGARRDEEKSRAKERIFSLRDKGHAWNPRQQRPEPWQLYNTRLGQQQSLRVFPLSNWTEMDIWRYVWQRRIELAPLYFSAPRPVIERDGMLLVLDQLQRMPLRCGEQVIEKRVRFRTLGCWPVTAATESEAMDVPAVIRETVSAAGSERFGRLGDSDAGGSLEQHKREGYF